MIHTPSTTSRSASTRGIFTRALVLLVCAVGVFACATSDDVSDVSDSDVDDDGEDSYESTSEALTRAGPCSEKPIDRAVKCVTRKGARVLSYYRSPADQQRVRRENRCRNTCIGMAGCVRPTANCESSPHTRCLAVDLVDDGAPLTEAQLRDCGFDKKTMPHRNHYDYVGN